MTDRKERREERSGSTVERLDAPGGHFRPTPKKARRIWPSGASQPRYISQQTLLRVISGLILALAVLFPIRGDAQEQPIVADLSKHLVAITTGFAGTDVLLFGATDGPGDLVMVVRGPAMEETVRRKGRVAGLIWANQEAVTFENAPSFYHVAATGPLEEILPAPARERHEIGADLVRIQARGGNTGETIRDFRDALIRLKTLDGLYAYRPDGIRTLANRLFRAELRFPANVPTGTYMVSVYLVRDGQVVSAEITPLVISKVGIGADIFQFAQEHSAWYGISAIVIAVVAGWIAGIAFRKS